MQPGLGMGDWDTDRLAYQYLAIGANLDEFITGRIAVITVRSGNA